VLRRIFGPKQVEVTVGWRKLHNEELHNWYFSINMIRIMKSRRVRKVGQSVCTGEMRTSEGKRTFRRL
jgi:hypothetical protein